MRYNILYITPNFNLACGVSKHVFTLLTSEELNREFNLYFITNGGDAIYKLDQAGVNYHIENFKTDTLFHFDFLKDVKWLKKYCKVKDIHLIHSHHRYPEYLSNVIKKSLGIKTVITVHNFVGGLKHFSYKSDCVISINNSVKDHLLESFSINAEKIEVLYNCVKSENDLNINKGKIKQSLGISEDHAVILYLGRIVKEKRIDLLVNALKLLVDSDCKIVLVMAGSGEFALDKIKDLYSNRIKIFPPSEQVQKFYAIAEVVVLPSQREPFGYTMLEAGLNKVPFIGSRTGGIAEFIEDGVDGYLFEPENAADLAEKIKFVLEHPKAAQNSALRLNEKVVRLCNCNNYFQKLTDIYTHLLEDK